MTISDFKSQLQACKLFIGLGPGPTKQGPCKRCSASGYAMVSYPDDPGLNPLGAGLFSPYSQNSLIGKLFSVQNKQNELL